MPWFCYTLLKTIRNRKVKWFFNCDLMLCAMFFSHTVLNLYIYIIQTDWWRWKPTSFRLALPNNAWLTHIIKQSWSKRCRLLLLLTNYSSDLSLPISDSVSSLESLSESLFSKSSSIRFSIFILSCSYLHSSKSVWG